MRALTMDPATEGGRRQGSRPCRWILWRRETRGGEHDPDDGSGDGRMQEAGIMASLMDPATEGGRRRGSRPCRWILWRRETGGRDHDPDDGSADARM